MNWNGQREALDHLIKLRLEGDPAKREALQNEYNNKRRARVMSAMCVRPVYIPLEFTMTAAAQTSPYRALTPKLGYDVIITGVKADRQLRDCYIRRNDEQPLVLVGDESSLYLRSDEFCGQAATTGGGQLGPFYFPQPLLLEAGKRDSFEVYKTDATTDIEELNIVLIGIRVYPQSYADILYNDDEKRAVERALQMRQAPETRFLKVPVSFSTAAAAGLATNISTPEANELLLVRGIRTTLRQSLIAEIHLEGEPNWVTDECPCWAIAAEDELIHDNYLWLSKPVYIGKGKSIMIDRIINNIDANDTSLIDSQTGNTITFICDTV